MCGAGNSCRRRDRGRDQAQAWAGPRSLQAPGAAAVGEPLASPDAQEMGQFSLAIHGLRPCSFQSHFRSLPRAQADSVISRALWGHKKPGLAESKTSLSNPISRSPCPLPQSSPALQEAGTGDQCLLPFFPLCWAWGAGGRAGDPQTECLFILHHPPPPAPCPLCLLGGSCCAAGGGGGRWREPLASSSALRRHPFGCWRDPNPLCLQLGVQTTIRGPRKRPAPCKTQQDTPSLVGRPRAHSARGLWAW